MATRLHIYSSAGVGSQLSLGGTNYDYPRLPVSGRSEGPLVERVSTSIGSSLQSVSVATVAGPTAGVDFDLDASGFVQQRWETTPLDADVTISGTVTFNVWGSESSMNANAGMQVIVERHQPDGTITTIINSEHGTELGTSAAAMNWTGTPTSTACLKGDKIVIRVLANDAGGTMASGFTATLRYGSTVANTGESWVEFAETLTFQTADPAGTVLKLLDDASDVSGSGKKKLWTDAVSGVASKVTNTVASTSADAQVTDSAGGTALEWYTPQLQAVTLDDLIKVDLYGVESDAAANATWRVKLYKTASDGSSPTLVADGACQREIGTADGFTRLWLAVATSLTDGQRLMVRVYMTSAMNAPSVAGQTVTLKIEDNTNPSTITFTETLTEHSSAPGPVFAARGRTIRNQALLVRGGF